MREILFIPLMCPQSISQAKSMVLNSINFYSSPLPDVINFVLFTTETRILTNFTLHYVVVNTARPVLNRYVGASVRRASPGGIRGRI